MNDSTLYALTSGGLLQTHQGDNPEDSTTVKYPQMINRLIAADDLHYDPDERRLVSLSSEEVDDIIRRCHELGITDCDQIKKTVAWCGFVRVGWLLQRSFMEGRLTITGFSGTEPCFAPRGGVV